MSLIFAGDQLSVPKCLSGLMSLSKLELSGIQLVGHIQALTGLKGLQELHGEHVCVLPHLVASFFKTLGQLTSLTKLCLDSVGWRHVDFEESQYQLLHHLQGLSRLHTVLVKECVLRQLPVSANWTCLRYLDISCNEFDQLPTMPYLPSLTYLSFANQSGSFQMSQASDGLASIASAAHTTVPNACWSLVSRFTLCFGRDTVQEAHGWSAADKHMNGLNQFTFT